jgi:glycosyltransferase involved in cell wall biosynthesis
MKPSIVIAAYRREKSLSRLLKSVQSSLYPFPVHLIISLDGGASSEVIRVAEEFEFQHGSVEVIKRSENIGLRRHIIWCGDQSKKYESVIVFEDDLYVDPHFYYYAVGALSFYSSENRVAGVALYAQRFNEGAGLPFEPIGNSTTGYFMQIPCSCGQAWTRQQWENFKQWYVSADNSSVEDIFKLPHYVKGWPESSWKKYFFAYLVEKDKYFFYPYMTYSTNCSDAGGSHLVEQSDFYQVPLSLSSRPLEEFRFLQFDTGLVYYDSFMEPQNAEIFGTLGINENDLEIDFNGSKPLSIIRKKKYVLTSKKCNNFTKVFRLCFKPIEKNIIEEEDIKNPINLSKNSYIYLAKSEDVLEESNPYFNLAKYYSYFSFGSKSFAIGYLFLLLNKVLAKLSK